jgi:hypothetical protein
VRGERPSRREQLRSEVGGDDVGAGERGRNGGVPGPGGHVEHPLAGADPGRGHEDPPQLGDDVDGNSRVVAECPHRPVPRLDGAIGVGGVDGVDGVGHGKPLLVRVGVARRMG